MVKKTIGILIAILLFSAPAALAGDIPEGIMSGRHRAMFIGQITDIGKDTMAIQPLTVMMGAAGPGEIMVKRFKSYSLEPHDPRKGDCIIALLLDDTAIDETWVFECDGSDYRTLKIVANWKDDMVTRYERYINDGAYFEAQKRLDAKKASAAVTQQTTIAPTPASAASAATTSAGPSPQSLPVSGGEGNLPSQSGKTGEVLVAVGALLVSGVVVVFVYSRKWKFSKHMRWRW